MSDRRIAAHHICLSALSVSLYDEHGARGQNCPTMCRLRRQPLGVGVTSQCTQPRRCQTVHQTFRGAHRRPILLLRTLRLDHALRCRGDVLLTWVATELTSGEGNGAASTASNSHIPAAQVSVSLQGVSCYTSLGLNGLLTPKPTAAPLALQSVRGLALGGGACRGASRDRVNIGKNRISDDFGAVSFLVLNLDFCFWAQSLTTTP